MSAIERARSKLINWRENPAQFVVDNFKVEPDIWQLDALKACGGPPSPRRRLAMKACTGPGKSAALAWIGWHRLSCFGNTHSSPKGAALSGEGRDNLRDNLWAELFKWQQRSEFLKSYFKWNQEKIVYIDKPDWFLSARSYAKDANGETVGQSLSGLHSEYPFILLDETGGMPSTVGQRAEQIFTGGTVDGLIAQAGNPTDTSGLLYHSCILESDRTTVITITADPDDPKRTPRVDIEHARDQIKRWGKDNPWVMATILGQFPPSSMNSLIGPEDVEAAMNRHLHETDYMYSQKRLGVDVARFGDDRTVIFPRQGLLAFKPAEMRGATSPEIAARVSLAKQRWQSEIEFVDGTGGYGSGVVDSLRQAGHTPLEISFAGKAIDRRYLNKRAEMWFLMVEWIKRGGVLPKIKELVRELSTPTYTYVNGQFQLEPKDMIKKRLGFSPDIADALALTFAIPDQPSRTALPAWALANEKMLSDFDPFDPSRT